MRHYYNLRHLDGRGVNRMVAITAWANRNLPRECVQIEVFHDRFSIGDHVMMAPQTRQRVAKLDALVQRWQDAGIAKETGSNVSLLNRKLSERVGRRLVGRLATLLRRTQEDGSLEHVAKVGLHVTAVLSQMSQDQARSYIMRGLGGKTKATRVVAIALAPFYLRRCSFSGWLFDSLMAKPWVQEEQFDDAVYRPSLGPSGVWVGTASPAYRDMYNEDHTEYYLTSPTRVAYSTVMAYCELLPHLQVYDGSLYDPGIEDPFAYEDDESYEDDDSDRLPDGMYDYHSHSEQRKKAVRFHAPLMDDALKADTLTLGMECEIQVESRGSFVHAVANHPVLDKVCVMEADGSLDGSRGVELVFGWSTLGTVVSWAEAYAEVVKKYSYDMGGCGLHIATNPLPTAHVARIMGFIYAEDNAGFVAAVSGRGFTSYADNPAAGTRGPAKTPRQALAKVHKNKFFNGEDRYWAINVRSSGREAYENTVEWRLFKGTANVKRLLPRLEMVWALTKYADPTRLQPLTWKGFVSALANDVFIRRHTPHLRKYITSLGEGTFVTPALAKFISAEQVRATKKEKRTVAA